MPLSWLRKEAAGKQKWYEKIGVTYSANFQNRLNTTGDKLSLNKLDSLTGEFRNGVNHVAAATTSLKAWHFTINPRVSYNERWFFKTLSQRFDEANQEVVQDTINGFRRTGDISYSTGLTTNIFGMYTFKSKKLKAIRHTISPTASFTYRPEVNRTEFGFIGEGGTFASYNPFILGAYTASDVNESGSINLRLTNRLEAKVATNNDSTANYKKIPLLEIFDFSSNYNITADSMKWSPIGINARTRLFKNINLTGSGTLNPYAVDNEGNFRDEAQYSVNQKIGTLTNARLAVSMQFKSKTASKLGRERGPDGKKKPIIDDFYPIPWRFSVNYNINYRKQFIEVEDPQNLTQALSFNGEFTLFKTMRFGFNSGYDFETEKLTYTTLNLYCCLLYTSPSPRDRTRSRMPSSA